MLGKQQSFGFEAEQSSQLIFASSEDSFRNALSSTDRHSSSMETPQHRSSKKRVSFSDSPSEINRSNDESPTAELSRDIARVMFTLPKEEHSTLGSHFSSQQDNTEYQTNAFTLSQDTGYQTNSLQMTCQSGQTSQQMDLDTSRDDDIYSFPSKHTDLTSNMSELPLYFKESSEVMERQQICPAPPTHAVSRDRSHFDESEQVIQRAREVLARLDNIGHGGDSQIKRSLPVPQFETVTSTSPSMFTTSVGLETPQRQIFQDLGVIGHGSATRRILPSKVFYWLYYISI